MSIFGYIGLATLVVLAGLFVALPLAWMLGADVGSVLPQLALVAAYVGVVAGGAVWALERWL